MMHIKCLTTSATGNIYAFSPFTPLILSRFLQPLFNSFLFFALLCIHHIAKSRIGFFFLFYFEYGFSQYFKEGLDSKSWYLWGRKSAIDAVGGRGRDGDRAVRVEVSTVILVEVRLVIEEVRIESHKVTEYVLSIIGHRIVKEQRQI